MCKSVFFPCFSDAHHSTVKRIRFQPLPPQHDGAGDNTENCSSDPVAPLPLRFASCSSDHSVRIYTVTGVS